MAETALNFGPDWLRALSHGSATSTPTSLGIPIPKYSLAEFRYGREEMLALIPKNADLPECLNEFPHLIRDKFQIPLALTPVTEEEQRIWARSVNSEAVLRASGKTAPGNGMGRSGRGGSVDRGRGRGRGGYYQRGLTYEDSEDGPPSSYSRPKPIERSQSANEKDQRWDDRDRRFDRTFSGRGAGLDDSAGKQDIIRGGNDYWRKFDKDDDGDWRSSGLRSSDKLGGRGSWRNSEKDRRDGLDRNSQNRNVNGIVKGGGPNSQQKTGSHHSWKDDGQGNNLPEWSVDEASEPDVVGTFDSSGAFLETKVPENSSLDEIYVSDEADEGTLKNSPEASKSSSKKTQKKTLNSTNKQPAQKRNSHSASAEETVVEKHPHQPTAESCKNISKTSVKSSAEIFADNVIKTGVSVEQHVKKTPVYIPVTSPNVPEDVVKSTNSNSTVVNSVRIPDVSAPSSGIAEEDAFAHHKKATENMVAQWTEEEEQRVISQSNGRHPPQHESENKWFYQDPQGEIQGPFTSPEMLEWFSAGYFTMSLMVRRGCDEKFSQLGELIKSWGRVPFMPGNSPPPIRVTPMTSSLPTPMTQTIVPNPVAAPTSAQLPKQDDQLLALQQQLIQQQFMQQTLMIRQAQLQQILAHLKQQENFSSLNSQQQQQVVMQQYMAQQQVPRPSIGPMPEQPNLLESVTPVQVPLLGLPLPPLMKNDMSLWNIAPASGAAGTWPVNINTKQPPGGSIWDVDLPKSKAEDSELEKQKLLAEEQEKIRKAEEQRLEQEKEREEKRKQEELRRKQEETRLLELQKQEEEKRRLEELQRQKEEEQRRQEELRRIEEQKRKEEEQRKQEELRKLEEMRRLEELKRQEEQKRMEELKRKEEQRKLEEQRKQEELRKQEEQQKLEEKRKREEAQKKIQMEKEREKQLELERQKEALRIKELEREERLKKEKEKQEIEMKKLAELKKSQGPVWGLKNPQNSELSLADIQRLQEEKEREEKEERLRQQLLQQQAVKQVPQNKNGLSWAKRSSDSLPAVKSLAEIQQEEAERLAQLHRSQKIQAPAPVLNANVGVWGNASHLNKITAVSQSWSTSNIAASGFWDDALNSTQSRKQTSKNNDSAFPALANPVQPATVNSNKSKNVRAKKEEDVVTRLFGTHRKPTDEFTIWCTEAISSMPSSVDVPTFVAFLKDIESPYEVFDYVKSYFGEGKEPREFAKQFLERRSKYRNQAKQAPAEVGTQSLSENMLWGPAPAITPTVNKTNMQTSNDCDGNSSTKAKSKKKRNKMQKLDSSMLGFTVQSNPDRLNVGEIDHVEGM